MAPRRKKATAKATAKHPDRMGRPDKLTKKLGEQICDLVRAGNYLESAAAIVDINRVTLRRWLKKGAREKSGLHHEFCIAYKAAESESESSGLQRVREHGKAQWQAEAWWLERRFPMRWGRWQRPDDDVEASEMSGEYVVTVRRPHVETTSTDPSTEDAE